MIATEVMAGIPSNLTNNLTISLIDERYGAVGHADSNYYQLMESGFNSKNATCVPILRSDLKDINATTAAFNTFLSQALSTNDICIGLLGVGSDGHTAGILPDSPAAHESNELAVCYESQNKGNADPSSNHRRITTTFTALRMIDVVYCCAYGSAKLDTLARLQQTNVSLADQPAQILKQISESYVYNDQIGESL